MFVIGSMKIVTGKCESRTLVQALACGLFVSISFALQGIAEFLEYDRGLVLSGQYWRLLTCHWVHSNGHHLLLNVIGGVLLYWLFLREIRLIELALVAGLFSVELGLMLFFFIPYIDWYNGLSGVLHAMAGYYFLRLGLNGDGLAKIAFGLLVFKLLYESVVIFIGIHQSIGAMSIITETHVFGVVAGIGLAILQKVSCLFQCR